MRVHNAPLLLYCLSLTCFASSCGARQHGAELINDPTSSQRLAVVIPSYRGDLSRTVSSLERWPTECSPVTLEKMDLVLYYAEGEEDNLAVTSAVDAISAKAGRCFAKTRTVYANLDGKDDVYPNGPSAMFYKMYLDGDVRSYFSEYDALAVIEWDVLVASERSFEQLYYSAFQETQTFWVKGSRMGGADFHSNADLKEMWKVLGHINGNAIYNNNDPEFMEYVRYTHARWELKYPYDVALWLTVSDFPYSWPLWQRYSSKFVTTNLISNVGREHVDHEMVSDAIEIDTLFIHGSRIDEGNIASIQKAKTSRRDLTETGRIPSRGRKLQKWRENKKWREIEKWKTLEKWRRDYGTEVLPMCLSGCAYTSKDGTRGRVCDLSCESGDPYGTKGCGARQGRYGANCRACYNSLDKAHRQDTPEDRAIMCDTLQPVETVYNVRSLATVDSESAPIVARGLQKWRENKKWREIEKWKTLEKWRGDYGTEVLPMCLSGCAYTSKDGTRGRVCDLSCESGDPYGTKGCGARQGRYGDNCRACYNSLDKAHRQDTPEDRAIMCDTLQPVETVYNVRSLATVDSESAPIVARGLQKWRENKKWREIEKWKTLEKWRGDYGTEVLPMCLSGCAYTSKDGTRGRVCDLSCESGDPYGTKGCGARQGRYGDNCRACYNSLDKAHRQDTPEDRAIMCDTLQPVETVYNVRSLATVDSESAPIVARGLQKWRENKKWREIEKWKTLEKWRGDYGTEVLPMCLSGCVYTSKDGTRGRVCDLSCESGDPYGTKGCGARQGRYGDNCRACYNSLDKAHRQDTPEDRAIMCDTLQPVETVYNVRSLATVDSESAPIVARGLQKWRENKKWREIEKWKTLEKWRGDYGTEVLPMCLSGCAYTSKDGTRGRVCDLSCESGDPYGTKGCGARQGRYGDNCRACYNSLDKAHRQDTPENRAIMCDTLQPVETVYNVRSLATVDSESAPIVARGLQKWRENKKWREIEKWKTLEKWRGDYGTEVLPMCLSGCAYTSKDGTRGRVCDLSCESGDPYGTKGCGARQGRYGDNCRACYNSLDKAHRQDTPENRAIMCNTLEPVPTAYDARSLASVRGTGDSAHLARGLRDLNKHKPEIGPDDTDLAAVFEEAAIQPFARDLVRGGLCVFITGHSGDVHQVEVTAMSILQFVPGVRVAIAAEEDTFDAYERVVGIYPGVTVRSTPDASTASLFADDFCGVGTSLVYYVKPASVLSRTFTSKDTHSPMGDLLVMYSNSPSCYSESALARQTNAILGFEAPTFTCGTDLILPVGANADLRDILASHIEMRTGYGYEMVATTRTKLEEINDISAIPQMLAAIAYAKKTSGVWFINPQAWVSEHLFKAASIWEIPLVKPRISCSLATTQSVDNVAGVLRRNLDFFTQGGTCENGIVHI